MTTDTKLQKYSIALDADRMILQKNGAACSCPFRNPVLLPHPTLSGQLVINNPICSSACQFFDFEATYYVNSTIEKGTLELSCSSKKLDEVLIEKEKKSDNSRPQDSKIITL
jgi:hypothetical protein